MKFLSKFLPAMLLVTAMASGSALASILETIKKQGYITVACEPGFLPFEMQTPKGEYIGFDIDMMKAFAKDLGVEARFVATKWDGIIPGLLTGRYDAIVSGMTITAEREKVVLFSDPYYDAGLKILVSQDLLKEVKTLEALDVKGRTIAVKLGTTGDIFAEAHIKNARIRKLDSEADAAQSVLLGRVDAFIYDKPYLEIYSAGRADKVGLFEGILSEEKFGLAARRRDQELITAFNEFLKRWRADKEKGYDYVYKQYFVDMTWKKHFPDMF